MPWITRTILMARHSVHHVFTRQYPRPHHIFPRVQRTIGCTAMPTTPARRTQQGILSSPPPAFPTPSARISTLPPAATAADAAPTSPPQGVALYMQDAVERYNAIAQHSKVPLSWRTDDGKKAALHIALHGAVLRNIGMTQTRVTDDGAVILGAATSSPVQTLDIPVGQLLVERFVACARKKLWWMAPLWGTTAGEMPPETQFLLTRIAPDMYCVFLPLIDRDRFRAVLRSNSEDPTMLMLRVDSGNADVRTDRWDNLLYIAAGRDPYDLVQRSVVAAARLSGGARSLQEKQIPPSIDYFGWCTWDAFYSNVSAAGIATGLQSFADGGIRPKWLIIDDGWQLTDVDSEFRTPPTAKLLHELGLVVPGAAEAADAFVEAELEVLSQVAKQVPQSTSAGAVLEEVSHMEVAPSDMKRLMEGQLGTTVPQRHSLDGDEEARRVGEGGGGAGGGGGGQGEKGGVQEGGRTSATGMRITGDEKAQVFAVRVALMLVQRLLGLVVGLAQGLIVFWYTYFVDVAPPSSWQVRLFSHLANGPGRNAMLQLFADSGNFSRRLLSIKANGKFSTPHASPDLFFKRRENLALVVKHLRTEFDLAYIYVWHALAGYWNGIATSEAIEVAKYQAEIIDVRPPDSVLEVEPAMAWNPSTVAGLGAVRDPAVLYEDMHAYLAQAGIDGVKVDAQAGTSLIGSAWEGGAQVALRCHMALENSVVSHFGPHIINCMCHSSENFYRFFNSAIARVSDDFYPREQESFRPHIAACAYNGLFMSALVLPDWDMFQSKHPAAHLHATARAISGGAVYVSDTPGAHDFDLLRTLVLPDGTIPRPLVPAKPTKDCVFADVTRDNRSLLKLWTYNSCNAVIGVFNIQGAAWDRTRRRFAIHNRNVPVLGADVRVSDVPLWCGTSNNDTGTSSNDAATHDAATANDRWVVYNSARGDVRVVGREDPVLVELPESHAAVLTIAPVLTSVDHEVSFAPLGISTMINMGGTVVNVSAAGQQSNVNRIPNAARAWRVGVRGQGRFVAWASRQPVSVTLHGSGSGGNGGQPHGEICVVQDVDFDQKSGMLCVEIPVGVDTVCVTL